MCLKKLTPSEIFMLIFKTAFRLTFISCFSRSSFNVFQGRDMLEELPSSQATREFHPCRHFSLFLTSKGFYLQTGSPDPEWDKQQGNYQMKCCTIFHFALQIQRYTQHLLNKLWWVNPAVFPTIVVWWVEGVSFAHPWRIPRLDNSVSDWSMPLTGAGVFW